MTENLIFKEFWHIWSLNVKLYFQNSAVEEHEWVLKVQFRRQRISRLGSVCFSSSGLSWLTWSGKDKGLVGSHSSFLSAKDLYFSLKSVSQENELILQEAYVYIPKNSCQVWLLKHRELRKQAEGVSPSFSLAWAELKEPVWAGMWLRGRARG